MAKEIKNTRSNKVENELSRSILNMLKMYVNGKPERLGYLKNVIIPTLDIVLFTSQCKELAVVGEEGNIHYIEPDDSILTVDEIREEPLLRNMYPRRLLRRFNHEENVVQDDHKEVKDHVLQPEDYAD